MSRGKQQVLLNYLPGNTFDFERATIARVTDVRGNQRNDLNVAVLLRKVTEDARAWQPEFRPVLRDDVLKDPSRFVLLDPTEVQSELFPKVFWCQNRRCGRVFDHSGRDSLPGEKCKVCGGGLAQLRFVKVHVCGALRPLSPYFCQQCKNTNNMALDTRGSERITNFSWVCRKCKARAGVFGGRCRDCDDSRQDMRVVVHRAGNSFYAHTAALINIPHRRLDAFFNLPEWPSIAAAKFVGLPEVADRPLSDFVASVSEQDGQGEGISRGDLDELLARQARGELTDKQVVEEMRDLRKRRERERRASSPGAIARALEQHTGVLSNTWEQAGQEMLEAVMPLESGHPEELFEKSPEPPAAKVALEMGISRLTLADDYPMVTATYGFSRLEYSPNECRLNPFPPKRDQGGRFPIFVDKVQADALLLTLNPKRVHLWLEHNGLALTLPGPDNDFARRAYFVRLFDDVMLRRTLQADHPEARMVFGLLHTFSHLCVRQAALLCGLDRTSLSEYLLPRALTFAIYCNHRFGATIGALTALFEQSLPEWLDAVREARRCVYDPVCRERNGNCHACTHLAETSCRFFNLNLGRAFLFGGQDPYLGYISVGYLDPSLA